MFILKDHYNAKRQGDIQLPNTTLGQISGSQQKTSDSHMILSVLPSQSAYLHTTVVHETGAQNQTSVSQKQIIFTFSESSYPLYHALNKNVTMCKKIHFATPMCLYTDCACVYIPCKLFQRGAFCSTSSYHHRFSY